MPYRKIADIALLAGRIMLESNAETYRVEETMEYILNITRFETAEAFVLTTGLIITLDDPSIEAITLMQRIKHRSVNLGKIHQVNSISRELVNGTLSIDEAHEALLNIKDAQYSRKELYLANIVLALCFTAMLGGNLLEVGVTLCNVLVMLIVWYIFRNQKNALFLMNLISCTLIGIIGTLFVRYTPELHTLNAIIFGSIMPMVPGTLITNAIRDTFKGDYTSAVARTLETLIIGFSIAAGITIGLMLAQGGAYL